MSCIEGSNPSVSANTKTSNLGLFPIQGISSTPNFRMKRANKAKQIIGSSPLTGDGHSLNTIDYPVPTAMSQHSDAVILEISESIRSS